MQTKGHRSPRADTKRVTTYRRRGKHIQLDQAISSDDDADFELAASLQEALKDCSRQRLRSLLISLRKYANLDARVQVKELQTAFQEANVKLPPRTFQIIAQKFTDQHGVDYERLWKFLRKALLETGRDSIRALLASNIDDTSNFQKKTDTDTDKELIERLKEQFDDSEFAPNLESFKSFLRENDMAKCGKVAQHTVMDVVSMARLPIYGSLLRSVLKRCDQEKNQQISWPELVNLLETAWTELKAAYPDVAQKPLPKEPSRASINLSGIQKRLLSKKQSLANGEALDTHQTELEKPIPQRIPSARPKTPMNKPQAQNAVKTEQEEEKRPPSRGGFFKSVRGFLGASKKKQASPEQSAEIPVIQVEKEANKNNVAKTEEDGFVEVVINDKRKRIWCPDMMKDVQTVSDPPKERLKLDWIHGYSGRKEGSTILVLGSHEIAYYINNTVVLYDFEKHQQRLYREHTTEVRALAVHSDGVMMASGQCSSKVRSSEESAHIRIWRSDTLQTMRQIGHGMIHLSITALAFVPDKGQIVSIDQSLDREIALWDCNSGTKISETRLNTEMICVLLFHPTLSEIIITGGKEHLSWWKLSERGAILLDGRALYGSHLRPKYVNCAAHSERGDLITGDSNGTIYIWNSKDHRLLNMVKHAHGGPILDLIVYRNSVVSSGKDHTIRNWLIEKYMDPIGTFQISEQQGCVRILKKYKGYLLMGTTFNSILYLEMNKKGHPFDPPIEMKVLTHGSKNGIQCILPVKIDEINQFIVIGTDSSLDIFDAEERKIVWHCMLEGMAITCADISHTGRLLVCATKNGTVVGFTIERGVTQVEDDEEQKEPVQWFAVKKTVEETQINEWRVQSSAIQISSDEQIIAIAGIDFRIYLARIELQTDESTSEEKKIFIIDRSVGVHQTTILGLDFSKTQTRLLRSYDEDNETMFWNVEDLKEIKAKEVRNAEWESEHCRGSYNMAGLWKTKCVQQSGISSLAVSHSKNIVVVGDQQGFISMSRFPASNEGPFVHTYKCSLNRIQLVAFSPGDRFVITNSNDEKSIMQWKVL